MCPTSPRPSCGRTRQIDLAVHNEGERTFLELLEALPGRGPGRRCRASAIVADGGFVRNPDIERVRDLDEIPSPFLEGAFDSIMASQSRRRAGSACGRPIAAARSAAPSATGDRRPRPRSPSSARSASTARSTGSPTRRSNTSSAATPTSASRSATSTSPSTSPRSKRAHRLSDGVLGAEHQERDRTRLRDAEDPVRRRPEQGRGAVDAERRHDDAGRPSSATTSRSAPTWSCSGASPRDKVETY